MNIIDIFVSRRIDIDSNLIDNPLYVPVRCGAVFDAKNDSGIPGDDTGENISTRRNTFCEFTVQYWAWKNMNADYYGLCHYRRYLSFSEKRFKADERNLVRAVMLTSSSAKKFGLTDQENMKSIICRCDAVISEAADVRIIPTPRGFQQTVYDHWCAHDGYLLEKSSIDLMLALIKERQPHIYPSAMEYLNGHMHRGYNCYILKKDLFYQLCEFQFDILFEAEKKLAVAGHSEILPRTPAYLGEILYGIFMYHLQKKDKYQIKEQQLIFFEHTEKIKNKWEYIRRYSMYRAYKVLRAATKPFLPIGSRRREFVKRALHINKM